MTNKDTGNMLKISRKNIWKEIVPYVIDSVVIHRNGECESRDTEDRSDCSSSEDMNFSWHSHCNVSD
jgi:hypothetical protein